MRRIILAIAILVILGLSSLYAIGRGWLGNVIEAGAIEGAALPASILEERSERTRDTIESLGADPTEEILFGDLHVHSGFSLDAYVGTLPLTGGSGAYTVADACDFARYCSSLDFWSINDHAANLTPRRWQETIDSVRDCNARGTAGDNAGLVAFLGWEWTQMGTTPANHYGHKNVVLRHLDDDRIPARPIAASSPTNLFRTLSPVAIGALVVGGGGDPAYFDAAATMNEARDISRCADDVPVRDLPDDCMEFTPTPAGLFAKLDDWGHESLVIPHGNSWGNYTPPGSSFAKQLENGNHDPARQRLVEVYSGHGNAEEYRPYRAAVPGPDGELVCPEPTADHLPSCWQAGEIIRTRCLAENESDQTCEERARLARRHFLGAPGGTGHIAVGDSENAEWLDSGQCRDCFEPAFNHRPGSSVQAMLAARSTDAPDDRDRFRFGLIGSSDTHTSRAGSGYKEVFRLDMTDARLSRLRARRAESEAPPSQSQEVDVSSLSPLNQAELGRLGSYFYTGGLVAVSTRGRGRDEIWNALMERRTYGTSGPRILLFFELLDFDGGEDVVASMGAEVATDQNPRFRVRAAGSFEQEPGCPDASVHGLSSERLEHLCRGECANPGSTRRPITRIEVVRIRVQDRADDALDDLIEDPWLTLPCDGDPAGCSVEFTDDSFRGDPRDHAYYVRAIEAPAPAINAGGLRCLRDEAGDCMEPRPCDGVDDSDDCLEEVEPRAWSSPIFVDHASNMASHLASNAASKVAFEKGSNEVP
jgi:hypothetical protein